MKSAIIYCRVSSKKQQNDGDSLSNQEKACRIYCKNNQIQVMGVYKEAFTGKIKSRPIFDEAIHNAKENKIDFFIIFDIDRFSREGYGVYTDLKRDLLESGISLRDSKNIIQGSTLVNTNEKVDMRQYAWNLENSSEYAEVMMSTQAQIEGKKIIQRTIIREIELAQNGYSVRNSAFGYKNKKIRTYFGKATIQEKDPVEGVWIEEIFKMRAEGKHTDEEIVNHVNDLGYQSRRGKKLTIKQMQYYIKGLIYAGIVKEKWTGNQPIRAAYKGLIEINTWNRANRGKVKIIEIDKKEVKIEYNIKNQTKVNQPIIRNRKTYNPFYCYAKVLKCPICSGVLTGSTSKGRNGVPHHYYICTGKGVNVEKHKTYALKRNEVHKTLQQRFKNIKIDESILQMYDEIVEEVYKERIGEQQSNIADYNKHLKSLYAKENKILGDINKVIDYPLLLKAKNSELEEIKLEIKNVFGKTDELENPVSLEKFQYYCKTIIQHLHKLVEQTNRPDLIALVFEIVFNGKIEYEKIIYPTTKIGEETAILKQKKSSNNENFSSNLKWQAH